MTTIDESALPARARAAYERGRVFKAARETLLVLPFVALTLSRCPHLTLGCVASLALLALVGALRWRGGVWGRAAVVGCLAALPALVMPLLLHGCLDCSPGMLARICGVLCATLGLFSGTLLGTWSARQGADRRQALLGGGLVIAVCGALGCAVVGMAAIGGMWIGATLATVGALRLAR